MTLAAVIWSATGPVAAISAPDGQAGELKNAGNAEAERRNALEHGENLGYQSTVVDLAPLGSPSEPVS